MFASALWRYPVKSLRGEPREQAPVDPWGIRGDRRWMVVDAAGGKLSSIRHHRMLTVQASLPTRGGLRIQAEGHPDLQVTEPTEGPEVTVTLRGVGTARAAGPEADSWLSEVLDLDVRLVWLDDPRRRSMTPKHGGLDGDTLSLADAAPLLLTTVPSLRRLDAWVAERPGEDTGPLSMERFRPNLVVDGPDLTAFAEDGWRRLLVGDTEFRFARVCDRCATTTVDPDTGRSGKEPLRTLAVHRRWDGHCWFGIRIVPLAPGRIRVGDPVVVLERKDPDSPTAGT